MGDRKDGSCWWHLEWQVFEKHSSGTAPQNTQIRRQRAQETLPGLGRVLKHPGGFVLNY